MARLLSGKGHRWESKNSRLMLATGGTFFRFHLVIWPLDIMIVRNMPRRGAW
jgi:hypothetical protein